MLKLYTAREIIDKERFLYDHQNGDTLVVVPDQYTLIAEEQALRCLGVTCLLDVEILSMSRLGLRVLTEQGLENVAVLDQYERYMLITRIIREHREALDIFRSASNKRAFAEMVSDFISDFKQQECSMEELEAIRDAEDTGEILKKKIEELALLLGAYEEALTGKYKDHEDYITLYIKAIRDSEWLRGQSVWVYGFDSLTPKNIDTLLELSAVCPEVSVILNESDFGLERLLTGRIMAGASERNVAVSVERISDEAYRLPKAPAIEWMERELFRSGSIRRSTMDPSGSLRVVECANPYYEAESAAAYVYELIREEGYAMRDIVLIANDADAMQPIIKRTFEEYGLPVFLDSARSIRDTQVVSFIVSLLDILNRGPRTASVLALLKSGLTEIADEDIWLLESYTRKYKIRTGMWGRPFRYGTHEYDEESMARIQAARASLMEKIDQLKEIAASSGTVKDFTERFYFYLNEVWDLKNRIEAIRTEQFEAGRIEESERTAQSYNAAIQILDRVRDLMGAVPMDAAEFSALYAEGVSGAQIGMIPPTVDGLSLGTMIRTRPAPPRAVVILGANEGILPMEPPSEGLFSIDEKACFEQHAFRLGKLDDFRVLEENAAIYRLLARASDKVYLSYSMTDGGGKDLHPSALVDSIRNLFPKLTVGRDVVSEGFGPALVQSGREALRHTMNYLKDGNGGEAEDLTAAAVLRWYERTDPESLKRVLSAGTDENRAEDLPRDLVKRLYAGRDGSYSFSASRLERFYRCPYKHFVAYGISPEEERIYQSGAREIGDVYHECLLRLSERLLRDRGRVSGAAAGGDTDIVGNTATGRDSSAGSDAAAGGEPEAPVIAYTEEELDAMLREELSRVAEAYRGGLLGSSGREEYRTERIYLVLADAIRTLVKQLGSRKLEQAYFEERFGRGCRFEPIEYTLNGEKIYIEGKIDRVDLLAGGNVRIVDYKTGEDKVDLEEMRQGYKMQLAVYLQGVASETAEPAGMFYLNLRESDLGVNGRTGEKQEAELAKEEENRFRLRGTYVNEPAVLSSMPEDVLDKKKSIPLDRESFRKLEEDVHHSIELISTGIVRGEIAIEPAKRSRGKKESECKYCSYKSICRFDLSNRYNRYRMV